MRTGVSWSDQRVLIVDVIGHMTVVVYPDNQDNMMFLMHFIITPGWVNT